MILTFNIKTYFLTTFKPIWLHKDVFYSYINKLAFILGNHQKLVK
jgi:hypothetical protein